MANRSFSTLMGFGRSSGSRVQTSYRTDMATILGRYKKIVQQVKTEVVPNALVSALTPTLELSKIYCPKDTGALVGSAFLEIEDFRGSARVVIGYAKNSNPPYAIFVHEMDYSHEEPTSRKFLERALNEDYDKFLSRIFAAMYNGSNSRVASSKEALATGTKTNGINKQAGPGSRKNLRLRK